MKKSITVATFISNSERPNKNFDILCRFLEKEYNINAFVYSDEKVSTKHNNIIGKKTKYLRIIDLIERAKDDNILFVDNDITINENNILNFVNDVIDTGYALAWGIIRTSQQKNIVEKLIDIDKLISHYIIRPISWKLKIGISLPGQVFMLNKKYYIDKLPRTDTLYDDLEIGACTKEYHMPVKYTKYILGYEKPKHSLKELLIQRKRWAKGFVQILRMNKGTKTEKYVITHGILFNMLWIPTNIILGIIAIKNIYVFALTFILLGFWFSHFNPKKILYAFIYILLYWIIYFIWLINIIRFLFLKEKK